MIINSLLDTDLYKFTMLQVVLHHFPGAQVEYRFKCRNEGVDLVPCIDEIRDEIDPLCTHRFREREIDYLRGEEWAADAEDILYRRTKLGLHVPHDGAARLDAWLAAHPRLP